MAIMKGYGVIEPTVSWGWMEKGHDDTSWTPPYP